MIKSYELKLSRATTHIASIEKCFTAWLNHGYRVFEQTNNKGRVELLAEILEKFPSEISLTVGDALHCLRDSLDHIAFDLSLSGSSVMTDEQERQIMFPISDAVVNIGDKRIKFMPINARQAVINLLPDPTGNQFKTHPLRLLNKMNNRDKHRTIPVIVATSHIGGLTISSSNGSDYFHILGTARPELGKGPVAFMEFNRSPNVNANITYSTQIEFDKGMEVSGNPVITLLKSIEKHIRDTVIPTLKPFLR